MRSSGFSLGTPVTLFALYETGAAEALAQHQNRVFDFEAIENFRLPIAVGENRCPSSLSDRIWLDGYGDGVWVLSA